ncbi:uncharacterized protein LOC128527578 isoform X2 [Clarias gariepinus]|uniref:uncharacterized protein LOC128527578 isoform X2 n=1 Tax=Clarias gariepinus TaxID=13013 RepID=UPI00234E34DC|nr:uncharacterized protein LOC128527578 isoform X2 [Clarias gariepinus]
MLIELTLSSIRYNIVVCGGVDGYSRKILYLDAATNNKAETAFSFFLRSTQLHGLPSRVRGDQGVENLDIAQFMFTTRGTGRASFISGKSVHNQRQILTHLLEDGIIILYERREVSLQSSCGVWDIYKIWMRERALRNFKTPVLTGRVLYCKKSLTAQLWFLKLSAHWMSKPCKNFRELSILWNHLSHMGGTCTYDFCTTCQTNDDILN